MIKVRVPGVLVAVFGCVAWLGLPGCGAYSSEPGDQQREILHDGLKRTYQLHVPPQYDGSTAVPVVLVFHGGYGSGEQISRVTQFSALADREGFMVVYPDGIDRQAGVAEHAGHWNDGRSAEPGALSGVDDVGFVRVLISELSSEFNIDAARVYATGISNGGNLSHKLGAELSDVLAAIAPVAGSIGEGLDATFAPENPVSVLQIHGTEDGSIRWEGGRIVGAYFEGSMLSVDATVQRWVQANGCETEADIEPLPDTDPTDGATAWRETYGGGRNGTEVVLIGIDGGGHNWPNMPESLRGPLTDAVCSDPDATATICVVCRDFDATETIWEFFRTHPKQ